MQSYYNVFKLLKKEEVVSENCSWLFGVAPYLVFGAAAVAAVIIPAVPYAAGPGLCGDFILLIFILGFSRFFLSLAGLDTSSAFGGMGSSREVFISSFVEPVVLLVVGALALNTGSTAAAAAGTFCLPKLSSLIAVVALFFVTLAETSRIPVDNQETHLELTMVHEAMVLEYSGRSLALLELAAQIKQIVFITLIAYLLPPSHALMRPAAASFFGALAVWSLKVSVIGVVIALTEISLAKMRLFRVVDFLGFACVVSVAAVVAAALGW